MKMCLYLVFLFNIGSCNNIKSDDKQRSMDLSQIKEDSSVNRKKVQLIEKVLNLPHVLEFCKVKFFIENNKKIYILLKESEFKDGNPSITQNGYQVSILHSLDSLDTEELPFYRFKMELKGDQAFVSLFFEITGAIASGNLNYRDGHWVPDEKFSVGVK